MIITTQFSRPVKHLFGLFRLDSLGIGTIESLLHLFLDLVLDPEASVLPGLGRVPGSLVNCPRCDFGLGLVLKILLRHLVGPECVETLPGTIGTPASLESSHGPLPVNELFLALDILNIFPIVLNLSFGFAEDFFQLVHL